MAECTRCDSPPGPAAQLERCTLCNDMVCGACVLFAGQYRVCLACDRRYARGARRHGYAGYRAATGAATSQCSICHESKAASELVYRDTPLQQAVCCDCDRPFAVRVFYARERRKQVIRGVVVE